MRKINKWKVGMPVLLIISLLSIQARSQSTNITIRTAIELALANNPSLKADSLNRQIAAHQVGIAKAALLPQVNFNSKAEYNPAIATQMLPGAIAGQPSKEFVPVQFGTSYNMGNGVEATQTIFKKSSRLQVDAARLNTGISETKYQLSQEDLVFRVATAWYELQSSTAMIRTTRKDHDNIREIAAIAKAQYESGVLKRIDYESLQINAANIQSQLNQLQSGYDEQLAYFKYLLGVPADAALTITEDIHSAAITPEGAAYLTSRADVNLYRQLIQAKELDIKSIKAEKGPSVSAYFRFNYNAQYNQLSDATKNDYWYKSSTVGITTTIPIFDGYRRKSRLHLAQSELKQLQFRSEQQQQLANTEWETANTTLGSDRRQVKITQDNLVLAEQVYQSRKALYTEGVTSLIELLDAERELSQSRNLHTQALISVQTSLVNTHKANGTLLTSFINSL
ncbi:TolC family protein [Chitinophaga agrisoli]|uniref:TolC family protein n=1 Tax=Chitinophaga agrisoli TaxID=2607653 RepID=A0A5B2VS87_9BACT|nr:TolC family protein [Chitinophaga agrisoli]KAA2241498.1 TolC family protein [Chitinophaga agrisoli]